MGYWKVRNLERYQDPLFDEEPTSVRLHYSIFGDEEFMNLAPEKKWVLIGIWMLAYRNGGWIPDHEGQVAAELGFDWDQTHGPWPINFGDYYHWLELEDGDPPVRHVTGGDRLVKLNRLFLEFGQTPPHSRILSHWVRLVGFEPLVDMLTELGARDQLSHGVELLYRRVHMLAEHQAQLSREKLEDGLVLPTGWVWSAAQGRAVPPNEYVPTDEARRRFRVNGIPQMELFDAA